MNQIKQISEGGYPDMGQRLSLLRTALEQLQLDAVFLTSPQAVFYYSGFASTGYYLPHGLLITERHVVLVARDFESGPAASEAQLTALHSWTSEKPFVAAVADAFGVSLADSSARCGYENLANFTPSVVLDALKGIAGVDLFPVGAEIDRLRAIKSNAEITLARQAGSVAVAAMQTGLKNLKPGGTEIDVAATMMTELVRSGGDVPATFPYAYFGTSSWCRMQPPSRRVINCGDTFYLEVGASKGRYGAAILRTGILGQPDPELTRAYAAAREAFEAMEKALVPGATSAAIDMIATSVLSTHGLAEARLLKAGYSIGIGFAPGWGEANAFDISAGNPAVVQQNLVLHLVMVLMLQQFGAIGLSETVHVTAAGPVSLTPFSRDLVGFDSTFA